MLLLIVMGQDFFDSTYTHISIVISFMESANVENGQMKDFDILKLHG